MKSLALVTALILCSLLSHQAIRIFGFSRNYLERSYPFLPLKQKQKAFAPKFLPNSYLMDLEQIERECSEFCVLLVPLYWSTDQNFWVMGGDLGLSQHLKSSIKLSDQQILSQQKYLLSLQDFVVKFPKAKLVLSLDVNLPDIDKVFIKYAQAHLKEDSFIICSKFGNLVRAIRQERPHWTRCASADEITKAHMLSSIYLESVAPLPAEFYLFDEKDLNSYSPQLFKEISRRSLISAAIIDAARELDKSSEKATFVFESF